MVHENPENQDCMKTFDFAYWVTTSIPIKEKEIPTDRFKVYADDYFTAFVNGSVELRGRLKALGNAEAHVGKVSLTEIL